MCGDVPYLTVCLSRGRVSHGRLARVVSLGTNSSITARWPTRTTTHLVPLTSTVQSHSVDLPGLTLSDVYSPFYVFGIAVELGNIQETSSPITWAIGYVRDPTVTFTTSSGAIQTRRPYWTTQYSDVASAVRSHVEAIIRHPLN